MGWSEFWDDVGENLGNLFGGSAKARKNAESQMADYRNAINQYTGSEGYRNALNTASKETARLAGQQAQQAAAQQQTAMRNAGLSGNAAAILAGNNASNAYQNAYNNNIQAQQQAAYNAGMNRLAAEQGFNTDKMNTANNNIKNSGLGLQNLESTAGTILSSGLLSDERTKTSITADDFLKKYKPRKLADLKVSFGG